MNKLYKNTLAVTICLLLIGCDITDFVDHRTGFRFINYTNKDIAILSEFIETNKMPNEKPIYGVSWKALKNDLLDSRLLGDPDFKRINRGDTLSIFVIDKDVLGTTSWSEICEKNLIKKRYDMYLERCKEWQWQIDYTGK